MASHIGAQLAGWCHGLTSGRLEPNPSQGLLLPATIFAVDDLAPLSRCGRNHEQKATGSAEITQSALSGQDR
jgi:hypothetical protein